MEAPLASSAQMLITVIAGHGEIITLKRGVAGRTISACFAAAVQKHSEIPPVQVFARHGSGDWYPDDE